MRAASLPPIPVLAVVLLMWFAVGWFGTFESWLGLFAGGLGMLLIVEAERGEE